MVSLLKPRLNRLFGGPHSIAQLVTAPSAPFTSITIHEWGLVHSIFVTVPRSVTDCLMSNSAAKHGAPTTVLRPARFPPLQPPPITWSASHSSWLENRRSSPAL